MLKNIFFILVCILLIQGCNKGDNGQGSGEISDINNYETIDSYFPFENNVKYTYGNSMGEQYSYTVYNTYIGDNRLQRIMSTLFGDGTEILEKDNGELRLVYGDVAFYFYEDITYAAPNTDILILKEPLQVGNTWRYLENIKSEITSMSTQVETPAGIFDAMEITNIDNNGNIEKSYYVKGIGLVKLISFGENLEFTLELLSFENDVLFEVSKDFYLYDVTNDEIIKETRILNIYTNMNYSELLETEMKKYTNNILALLTENTKINNIAINRADSSLILDLSNDFINELNSGALIEETLIHCIVNTVGSFYGVDKVGIRIDGEKYESGHIIIEVDEFSHVEI